MSEPRSHEENRALLLSFIAEHPEGVSRYAIAKHLNGSMHEVQQYLWEARAAGQLFCRASRYYPMSELTTAPKTRTYAEIHALILLFVARNPGATRAMIADAVKIDRNSARSHLDVAIRHKHLFKCICWYFDTPEQAAAAQAEHKARVSKVKLKLDLDKVGSSKLQEALAKKMAVVAPMPVTHYSPENPFAPKPAQPSSPVAQEWRFENLTVEQAAGLQDKFARYFVGPVESGRALNTQFIQELSDDLADPRVRYLFLTAAVITTRYFVENVRDMAPVLSPEQYEGLRQAVHDSHKEFVAAMRESK